MIQALKAHRKLLVLSIYIICRSGGNIMMAAIFKYLNKIKKAGGRGEEGEANVTSC